MDIDKGNTLTLVATLEGHKDRVWHVSWRPQGDLFATCSGDKTIRLWGREGEGWVLKSVLEDVHERTIRRVAFSPDGKFLATASFDAKCCIYELTNGKFRLAATLEGHENEVKSVAWDAGGSLIATCSRDKSVWIWEMGADKEFECISVLHGHSQDVKNVLWHPSAEMLISCSYDDSLKMWLEDDDDWFCAETLTGHGSTVWDACFNPNGSFLASVSEDKSLIVWKHTPPTTNRSSVDDPKSSWSKAIHYKEGHTRAVYSVDWGKTNLLATACGDDSLRIFKFNEARNSLDLVTVVAKAHITDVNCCRWSPTDSNLLVSTGDDNTVKIWRFNPQ